MPTHKTFKRRVRARMTHTGESYTSARAQLLRRTAGAPDAVPDSAAEAPTQAPTEGAGEAAILPTSDDASVRATGRPYAAWFDLLDGWGATERSHPDIARWLMAEHRLAGWWAQSITVAYERARGMRAVHQNAEGFQVGATRTVTVDADRALAAFTDPAIRRGWLAGVRLRQRPTTAAHTARFDIGGTPARLVVAIDPKADGRATVHVLVEKLADADAAAREKVAWRERLLALRDHLAAGG